MISSHLLPGRLLRRPGAPKIVDPFQGVQIDDPRLAEVLSPDAPLLCLYEGTLHGEGPIWHPHRERLFWSDVPNRRVLEWCPDGQVTAAIDATFFINGNALDAEGRLIHCEHGRRCISRSNEDGSVEPIVTHYSGKRLNSPNDITVAADGTIWFTDPIFGILMPNQGSLAEPELDHRSVYRFDPRTGELRRMADFEQPNGLFFSPDGLTFYVSDTSLSLREIPPGGYVGDKHEIVAFDVAANGSLSNRRFSAIPTTAPPMASVSTRAAGFGRRRLTASTCGRPRASGWASSRRRGLRRIVASAGGTCAAFSLPPPISFWPSISAKPHDTRAIRVFVAVADLEQVTRASNALAMMQSAVSKSVAALEGEVGLRLFDRVGRNISLTVVGAAFRDRARELLDHTCRLEAWAVGLATELSGNRSARAEPYRCSCRIESARLRRPLPSSPEGAIARGRRYSPASAPRRRSCTTASGPTTIFAPQRARAATSFGNS